MTNKNIFNEQQVINQTQNLQLCFLSQYKYQMVENQVNVDKIIQKLLASKGKQVKLNEQQIRGICNTSKKILFSQPMLLELQAPIKIVGDIHGQFPDLIRLFNCGGYPNESNYLFLGDYVDRGKQSIETMMLLLCYKVKHPQNFFLLRGNHEASQINKLYGFYDECKRRYSIKVWKYFTDVFNVMPCAAMIQQKILCMHGGISPQLTKINKIMTLNRPTEVPNSGLLCDILWSDPAQQVKGWSDNTQRGISYLFGADILNQFLKVHDLDLICRSHQIVQEGYQFFGKRQLVTIFSAPNYCGMFENWGALMNVDKDLICSFHVIKPQTKGKVNNTNNKKRPKTPKYIN